MPRPFNPKDLSTFTVDTSWNHYAKNLKLDPGAIEFGRLHYYTGFNTAIYVIKHLSDLDDEIAEEAAQKLVDDAENFMSTIKEKMELAKKKKEGN